MPPEDEADVNVTEVAALVAPVTSIAMLPVVATLDSRTVRVVLPLALT